MIAQETIQSALATLQFAHEAIDNAARLVELAHFGWNENTDPFSGRPHYDLERLRICLDALKCDDRWIAVARHANDGACEKWDCLEKSWHEEVRTHCQKVADEFQYLSDIHRDPDNFELFTHKMRTRLPSAFHLGRLRYQIGRELSRIKKLQEAHQGDGQA